MYEKQRCRIAELKQSRLEENKREARDFQGVVFKSLACVFESLIWIGFAIVKVI
jgi:hypothetical protein